MWCGAGEGGCSSSGKGTMEKKEEGGERKVEKLTPSFFSSRDRVSPLRLRISFLLLRSSRSPPRASTPQSPSASPLPPTTRNYAFCRHSRHGLGPRAGPPLRRSCHRRRRPSPVDFRCRSPQQCQDQRRQGGHHAGALVHDDGGQGAFCRCRLELLGGRRGAALGEGERARRDLRSSFFLFVVARSSLARFGPVASRAGQGKGKKAICRPLSLLEWEPHSLLPPAQLVEVDV